MEFDNGRIVTEISEDLNNLLGLKSDYWPTPHAKMVFLPNLFPGKDLKQSFDFAGGLHIFDQFILFKRN
jgi:hypothetical protein